METPSLSPLQLQVGLSDVDNCLSRIRTSITVLVDKHSRPGSVDLQDLVQQLLVHTTVLKMCHAELMRQIHGIRRSVGEEQSRVVAGQYRMINLGYERNTLSDEVDGVRTVSLSEFQPFSLNFPMTGVINIADVTSQQAHENLNAALRHELEERRKAKKELEDVEKRTDEKEKLLNSMKKHMQTLPNLMMRMMQVVEPVRRLVEADERDGFTEVELAEVRNLPWQLYVLAREAFSYRGAHEGRIAVSLIEEAEEFDGMYRTCERKVMIEVIGRGEAEGKKLVLIWKLHDKLKVVTTVGKVEGMELEGDLLMRMFPHDVGIESPNASNRHLDEGRFTWEAHKTGGGRPYMWANLLCGVGCLPGFEKSSDDDVEVGWPGMAAIMDGHVRFKEVMVALHERLRSRVMLEQQVDTLLTTRGLLVGAEELGFAEEPVSVVSDFVKLAREDWPDSNCGKFFQMLCMVVQLQNVKLNVLIGLQPQYPMDGPEFRISLVGKGSLCEQDMDELAFVVNTFHMDRIVDKNLLLCGRIFRLLLEVDGLVKSSETMNTGGENGDGEGGGSGEPPMSLRRLLCRR